MSEQPPLDAVALSAGVVSQRAVLSHDAVARHQQLEGVASHGRTDGLARLWVVAQLGQLRVAHRHPGMDLFGQRPPHRHHEGPFWEAGWPTNGRQWLLAAKRSLEVGIKPRHAGQYWLVCVAIVFKLLTQKLHLNTEIWGESSVIYALHLMQTVEAVGTALDCQVADGAAEHVVIGGAVRARLPLHGATQLEPCSRGSVLSMVLLMPSFGESGA